MDRVYLDTVITSGRTLRDLRPSSEMDAVDALDRLHAAERIKIVRSKMSTIEQGRTKDVRKRATLVEHQNEVSCVQADHRLLGFNTVVNQLGGFVFSPLISDIVNEGLFRSLIAEGLKDADAKHLM